MQESPWYTSDQAAIVLQRHPETIRKLCKQGKLEGARKIGGEWYIPRTTIDPPAPTQQPATLQQEKEPSV
jgi:excisionase family DNA binding protein